MRDQYYSQTCEAFQKDCVIVNNCFLAKKAWPLWERPEIITVKYFILGMALMKTPQRNYKKCNTDINSDKWGVASAPRCNKNFAIYQKGESQQPTSISRATTFFSIKISFGKTLAKRSSLKLTTPWSQICPR